MPARTTRWACMAAGLFAAACLLVAALLAPPSEGQVVKEYKGKVYLPNGGSVPFQFERHPTFVNKISSWDIPLECNRHPATFAIDVRLPRKLDDRNRFTAHKKTDTHHSLSYFRLSGQLHRRGWAIGRVQYRFLKPSGLNCSTGGQLVWVAHTVR